MGIVGRKIWRRKRRKLRIKAATANIFLKRPPESRILQKQASGRDAAAQLFADDDDQSGAEDHRRADDHILCRDAGQIR
jgi:hypothetical protein